MKTCANNCEAYSYKLKLRNLRGALLDAAAELRLAADNVEYWGAYAGEPFRDKWKDDVSRLDKMAERFSAIAMDGRE